MGTARAAQLRGREAEIAALGEALDRAASGRSAMVLLEGEAGIGKSRLLAAAVDGAQYRGMQVAVGRAEELEQARPFGLIASALECVPSSLDPRRAAIAGLLAMHGSGDRRPITVTSDPGLQFRVLDAFVDLTEQLALSGPLLIGVDDLQWADPSSLLTLGTLIRRLAYLPVTLIGCVRPSPRRPELARLYGMLLDAGARQISLDGLDAAAVSALVAESVDAEPGPGLVAEVAGAAGNPLFITELLSALIQDDTIQITDGRAEVTKATLPPTLRLTILRRISFLPERTLAGLRGASILGSSFTVTDLSVTMGQPAADLSLALSDGLVAGVLDADGLRLRFRHDVIREAIYEDLPLSVRRGLHREAGQRLAGAGRPALQVAEQLARGAEPGDAEAIAWLTQAAREFAARSPAAAADLLHRAIGLMHLQDPSRDQLLAEEASSLLLSGRITEAEAACRSLLERDHDPLTAASVRVCLGHALLAASRAGDALQELERVTRASGLSGAERANAQGWAGIACLWLGDLDRAAAEADHARSGAAAAGDHVTTSVALAALAIVAQFRGQLDEALHIIDDAIRRADASPGQLGHRYPVHLNRGHILIELDRTEEAKSALDTGRRMSEESGVRWPLASYETFRGVERFVVGEWDDAVTELEASFELTEETGENFSAVLGLAVVSLINLHRNDLRKAQEAAAAAAKQLADSGDRRFRGHWAGWARALLLEADHNTAEAFTTLTAAWDQCTAAGLEIDYPHLGPDLVRLALAAGDISLAQGVSAAVGKIAAMNDVPSLTGAALRCQGLTEDQPTLLTAASDAYARGPRRLELALACEDAGSAFARLGQLDRARPLLEHALEGYERLDAARDSYRAEATLRAAGLRRGRRGARKRPQSGWGSLTATERTVAGLVGEGLSNPQIGERLYISARTVQTHLAHVFAKLDISARTQLAAEVTKHRHTERAAG
jgi:DNA-binding CsgD family transcriptional regulator